MKNDKFQRLRLADDSWLEPHMNGFLNTLQKQGYAEATIETYRRMAARLCIWIQGLETSPERVELMRAALLDMRRRVLKQGRLRWHGTFRRSRKIHRLSGRRWRHRADA